MSKIIQGINVGKNLQKPRKDNLVFAINKY